MNDIADDFTTEAEIRREEGWDFPDPETEARYAEEDEAAAEAQARAENQRDIKRSEDRADLADAIVPAEGTKTIAAQITFTESPLGGQWRVRFLHRDNVTGRILGRKVAERSTDTILELREKTYTRWDGPVTRYEWTTPGETTYNGNRHNSTEELGEAQRRILDWAGRRFRVTVER